MLTQNRYILTSDGLIKTLKLLEGFEGLKLFTF